MTLDSRNDSKPTRALFLDFDGVLHSAAKAASLAKGEIPVDLLAFAKKQDMFCWTSTLESLLTEHPDVMVCVHSSWRLFVENSQMRKLLGPLAARFEGVTNKNINGRYSGIQELAKRAGIDDYRILDDAHAEFPAGCAELIACDPSLGISDPVVQHALHSWLSGGDRSRICPLSSPNTSANLINLESSK